MLKGTVFEDLASTDTQQDGLQGEEFWLEEEVFGQLKGLFAHTRKEFHENTARARQYNKFRQCGSTFSPSSFSIRDSHVVLGNRIPGDWYAGKIKQIFSLTSSSSEAYFVVQRFKEFSVQAQQDPYRQSLWLVDASITLNLRTKSRW
jgi:hypothetical protein